MTNFNRMAKNYIRLLLFSGMLPVSAMGADVKSHAAAVEEHERTRAETRRLQDDVQFDPVTQLFYGPYSDKKVDRCLKALREERRSLQAVALQLIREMLKNQDVPGASIEKRIRPEIEAAHEGLSSAKADNSVLLDLIDSVRFLIELRQKPTEAERLRLLKQTVASSSRTGSARTVAIDLIMERSEADAIDAMRGAPEDDRSRAASERLRRRIEAKKVTKDAVVEQYRARVLDAKATTYDGLPDAIWHIRELGRLGGSKSRQALGSIMEDKAVDVILRYEAQEALVRGGALKEADRELRIGY